MAVQSAVNARLREHLQAAFLTAFVSFVIGFLCLFSAALFLNSPLWFDAQTLSQIPLWRWTGGLWGMVSLSITVLIFPKLGGVQAGVISIVGQAITGIFIDHFGWLGAPQIAFSSARALGLMLVLIGVSVAVVWPNWRDFQRGGHEAATLWGARGLAVLGGAAIAAQAAVNGGLGQTLNAPVTATVVSFLGGALGLSCVILFYEKSLPKLRKPMQGKPLWIWSGGVLAALFISASIWMVPQLGTGTVVMLMLSGLIIGSLTVDHFGLLGVAQKRIIPVQIIGAIILLSGVACIRLL